MNKSILTRTALIAAFALASLAASAQNGSNSPYSRYGFGTLNDRSNGFNKGMAGVALGFRDPTEMNFQNPASYSAVDSLTLLFDIGASFQNANYKQGSLRKNARNTSIDYFNMEFRGWKRLGMSLGLMPYSSIGYNFSSTETLADLDGSGEKTSTSTYNGDGGLHELYFGAGWGITRKVSLGMNIGYLWGDYSHSVKASFSDTNIESLVRVYTGNINTYKLDFGAQYELFKGKKDLITLGATYSVGHEIKSRAKFINETITSSGALVSGDTVRIGNAYDLPSAFGVGVAWNHNDKWNVGLDYSCELWHNAKFPTLSGSGTNVTYSSHSGAFDNRQRFTLGGEYLPDNLGIHYRDHIRYRAGISYGTSYTKVNGDSGAKDLLMSLGVGLPIANLINNRSVLNISAQWENIRPSKSHLLTENYLRLCIGITFNEKWFQKWKVE